MKIKILFFTGLSVLILVLGLYLILKQNMFAGKKPFMPKDSTSATINNVSVFNEESEILLQQLIADSACIIFRFTPNTCDCLEPQFADGVKVAENAFSKNRFFVVIPANNPKDILFFRSRTKLSCLVLGTEETLIEEYDGSQTPYACIIYPNMTVRNIVSVQPETIKQLIDYAK